MSDIKWFVKVSYEIEVDVKDAWTEEGVKALAVDSVNGRSGNAPLSKPAEAEVVAVKIDGKRYEAPPF